MKDIKSENIAVIKIILSLFCLIIILSVFIQDYSGYIQSCIFNKQQKTYYAFSIFIVIFFTVLLGIIIRTRRNNVLFHIMLSLLLFYCSELLLRFADYYIFNKPESPIGVFYNYKNSIFIKQVKTEDIEKSILKIVNTTNSLGFNEGYDYSKEVSDNIKRIIFLGDSYTFGAGVPREKSYCKIVENYLNKYSQQKFEIFNAGVPGYGPYDSYKLFKLLKKEGYQYDAVVFSLFLQNDFTDNIKNTNRKVIGGYIHRIPDNIVLQYFHPSNTYIFRYSQNVYTLLKKKLFETLRTSSVQSDLKGQTRAIRKYRINPDIFFSFHTNYKKTTKIDFDKILFSITEISRECRCPFYIVIFPDQFYGDAIIRQELTQNINKDDYNFDIYYQWINKNLNKFNVLDLTDVIQQCDECYINFDTHLNERGNLLSGEAVANFLLKVFNTNDFKWKKN